MKQQKTKFFESMKNKVFHDTKSTTLMYHKNTGVFMKSKAQVSVEYLFIIGLALGIIIPGSMMLLYYSKESNERILTSQLNQIGTNLINNAEKMYITGKGSWITIELSFPEGTVNAVIMDNSELVITYLTPRGPSTAIFFSDINITGTFGGNLSPEFHSGQFNLKIESKGSYVSIGEIVS